MWRRSSDYSPEFKQRTVAMVADVTSSFTSEQEAILAVAGFLGIDNPAVIHKWMNHGGASIGGIKKFALRTWAIVIGVIVTIVGGVGIAYSQQLFGVGQPPSGPDLGVDQISLAFPGWTTVPNTVPTLSLPGPFKVDVKLLNTGTQLAIINSAELVMQRVVTMRACTGQAGLPVSDSYASNLPTTLSANDIVSVQTSEVVPADGADRFELLLRAPNVASNKIYLYRFHLYLTYNPDNARLDLGEFVISYPVWPDAGEYFWSKNLAANPAFFSEMTGGGDKTANVQACDIKGSHTLQSILTLPGARPPVIAAISSQLAY